VSRHWNSDEELVRCIAAEEFARARKHAWPAGATAGILLVAVSCIALGTLLYQLAGPRQVVEKSADPR
jgi:hypothetical protein